jgi:uncharacterized protein with HEPN domain
MSVADASRVTQYLERILEAIERAEAHIEGVVDASDFEQDAKSQDAVVRNIEVIGAAANRIAATAPDYLTRHARVQWEQVRALRDRIIQDDFEVDYAVVWQIVTQDLPALASQIKTLLALKPQ